MVLSSVKNIAQDLGVSDVVHGADTELVITVVHIPVRVSVAVPTSRQRKTRRLSVLGINRVRKREQYLAFSGSEAWYWTVSMKDRRLSGVEVPLDEEDLVLDIAVVNIVRGGVDGDRGTTRSLFYTVPE